MSSGGPSKKSGGSGGSGGHSKSKKSATNNATPLINPAAQPEFLVEKITGKRYWNGRPQVQVQWQGYPPEESTWEPMENIGNCMVLLADFEAELFKRKEHKKSLQKVLDQNKANSPAAPASKKKGATQERRLEIGQSTGPKANVTNSGITKPNAGYKMGNHKENPLVKNPIKQRPTSPMQLSELSDDEDLLVATSSLGKRAAPQASMPQPSIDDECCDMGTLSSVSSRSSSSSYRSSGSSSESSESGCQPLSLLAGLKTAKNKEEALKSIHSNQGVGSPQVSRQLAEKKPKDKTIVPGSSKKNEERSSKKSLETESNDDDSDSPLTPQMPPSGRTPARSKLNPNSKGFHWKMPLFKAPFGLARGLELDKVVHNFKVRDKQLMFVNWKGCSSLDAVPLDDLRLAYPAQVIQYFENMERRYED